MNQVYIFFNFLWIKFINLYDQISEDIGAS